GVKHLFDSAKDSDFTIFNDGLSIKNINELTWGYFKMDDNAAASAKDNNYTSQLDKGVLPQELVNAVWNEGEGIYISGYSVKVNEAGSQWFMSKGGSDTEYIVDLEGGVINFYKATKVTIAANQFEMNLINSLLEIKFIDLTYHQSWEYDVHINYTEQVNLGLKTVTTSTGASKQIFNFTQSVRDMTVNVTKTQAAITFDIVMGAVTAALALIAVIGPVIDGLSAAAEGTVEVTEAAGSAAIRGEQFASELGGSAEREASNVENETNALSNAARQTGGRMTSIKNAFNATRWKVFGGITAFVGAVYGVDMAISAIMEAMTKSEWEKVPGFDEFANAAIAPYAFPGVTGYDLTSAWLAGSLQIGLKAK
ncbi:MAG TPA: hypothetical protein PK156_49015, partial [Polyangium sp.]|nr:hypothetical protein [Polyangium sp.]